jgi:hypothetical protein
MLWYVEFSNIFKVDILYVESSLEIFVTRGTSFVFMKLSASLKIIKYKLTQTTISYIKFILIKANG